ncbi:hypothetical protein PUNSTDRAFT_46856 [Punctularia strigosozonata HHB-11173 SS5]|uniref:uncharacterized protein n=1 Tax=Punctularia strigosozonata (strain HHB-11173) TaxID=741275 RepID=UPI0004417B54|nr:uncharacterized protein PUNSTDRAFT_46856 [Punctularia strigosozonata HHB-11173 SS5]EIN05499.1 hypothetical protein PUNSTDRAFT_46856 [Punctularia strigosozonata HHB-11173 SS5]
MISSFGKKRYYAYAATLLVDIIVLALSARVNEFQEFFFVADKFPLIMSIITLVTLTFTYALPVAVLCPPWVNPMNSILLDASRENSFFGRAPFQLSWLFILSVFWLAFNAFSTSRWRHVPLQCDAIPAGFASEKAWCKDLQALKSFVWVEWLLLFLNFALTLRYTISQSTHGLKHVWSTSLSRYTPQSGMEHAFDDRMSYGQPSGYY